jgi:hypothetical protein
VSLEPVRDLERRHRHRCFRVGEDHVRFNIGRIQAAGHDLGDGLAQATGALVVLVQALGALLERDQAGGRDHARLPPGPTEQDLDPATLAHLLAVPQTSDPIGAPSPFETQNISVSTSAAYSATSTPEAALALKIRAPSRWTATPASSATFRMARKSSTSITVPPAWPLVFSRQTRSTISTS